VLQQLVIEGENLRGARTSVKLGGLEPIGVTPGFDGEIRIAIPDDTYPVDADHPATRPIPLADRLQAGPCTVEVQVLRPAEVVEGGLGHGVVGVSERRQSSNQSVFLLAPDISSLSPSSLAAGGLGGAVLTVSGRRLFRAGVKSVVLVGDEAIPVQDPGPGGAQTGTSIQVSLGALAVATPPLPAGSYPVRVMANGVQSIDAATFTLT
jgi:hypothetical protein